MDTKLKCFMKPEVGTQRVSSIDIAFVDDSTGGIMLRRDGSGLP
jgi:hypothetical protein